MGPGVMLHIEDKQDQILAVDQRNEDIVIVSGGRVLADSPGGAFGPELFHHPGGVQPICIHARHSATVPREARFRYLEASPDNTSLAKLAVIWGVGANADTTALDAFLRGIAGDELRRNPLLSLRVADALITLSRFQSAKQHLTQFLSDPNASSHAAQAYRLRGITALRQNQFIDAVEDLSHALDSSAMHPSAQFRARVLNDLGEALLARDDVGDLVRGENYVMQALQIESTDLSLRAAIYDNLGYVYVRRSHQTVGAERADLLEQALRHEFHARQLAINAESLSHAALIDNNIGSIFERQWDLRSALAHYLEALQVLDNGGSRNLRWLVLRNLGNVSHYLGDLQKARSYFDTALQMAADQAPIKAADVRCRLGTIHRALGELTLATEAHELCATTARKYGATTLQVSALLELAMDREEAGDVVGSVRALDDGIELLPSADADSAAIAGRILTQRAIVAATMGEFSMAQEFFLQATEYAENSRNPTVYVEALLAHADAARAAGNLDFAIELGRAALEKTEEISAHLDTERLRPAFVQKTLDTAVNLAHSIVERDRTAASAMEAIHIMERLRANPDQGSETLGIHDQLDSTELQKYRQRIRRLEDLAGTNTGGTLSTEYFAAQDMLVRERMLRLATPAPVRQISVEPGDIPSGTAVVYFLLSRNSALAVVIHASDVKTVALGDTAKFVSALRVLRERTESRLQLETSDLEALSSTPLAEALRALPDDVEHLHMVPQGSLHSFPWSALPLSSVPYQPLVGRFSVSVSHNLHIALQRQTGKPADDGRAIMISSPEYTVDGLGWSGNVQRLLWSQCEEDVFKRAFENRRNAVYSGSAATRSRLFASESRVSSILAIAAHAKADDRGAALALAPESLNEPHSGYVSMSDLSELRFENQLVVINGCRSSMRGGEIQGGERSIASRILQQGAGNAVGTLWDVSDSAVCSLMDVFYREIASGTPPARALNTAQNALRRHGRFRHPFFWASHQLHARIVE